MTHADCRNRADRIIAENAVLSVRVRAALASSTDRIDRARVNVKEDAADVRQMCEQIAMAEAPPAPTHALNALRHLAGQS